MPKTTTKKGAPPEGYARIEPTLSKLLAKLRDAQKKSIKTENKHLSLWPILQINHQISRYIYVMYYEKKLISKDLYDYLLKQKYTNADLIAKWKKKGYENLCCVNCIITSEKNHGNTCICRVPRATLAKNKSEDDPRESVECITCGCKGCASTD